jgi:lipoprotein-releasing system permease protein
VLLSPFEWTIAKRYMMPERGEAVIAVVAGIGVGVVTLSVAMLVIVMSVMNGFRAELFDKIVGLNGHVIVQGYGGRLDNWQAILKDVKATPGVVSAAPLIEQPLLASFNGRVEAIFARGQTQESIAKLGPKVVAGQIGQVQPDVGKVAIGSQLAANIGARVGDSIKIINPQGQATPFGTVPRQVAYEVAAIFEVGVYDLDERFVVMPMRDAQTLMMLDDAVGMIEVSVDDPNQAAEIIEPIKQKYASQVAVADWKTINSALFETLQVERVAMFFALSIIVLVAAFNILSSLIMLVRSKTRDIAILRTMGASRRSVLKIFVTTGSVVGLVGTFAGLALGFLVLFFRQSIVRGIEFVTGQNLWDPSIRFLTELPSRTDPVEVAMICLLSLGFSFLATLYPAWRAAGTDPVQVLRYE